MKRYKRRGLKTKAMLMISYSAERVKRLTANDIVNHFLKRRELVDLEEPIERIEERLERHR
jgi:hypothetical protein